VRIYGPSGTRNDPVDRNPLVISQGNGLAATGQMTSYTVPAGRHAILTAAIVGEVQVALAAGQTALVFINTTGQVLGSPQLSFEALAPVGTREDITVPGIHLTAGQQIVTSLALGGGAGVFRAYGAVFGIEFDA